MFKNIKYSSLFFLMLLVVSASASDHPIRQITTDQKVIALTFDDGPGAGTLKLLELFDKEGVKVTFFVIGEKVKKHPDILKKTVAAGHEIGNHSYTHPLFRKLSPKEVRSQIIRTQEVIKKTGGVVPVVFRAPGLQYSPELFKVLRELKMPAFNACGYAGDYGKNATPQSVLDRMKKGARAGGVLLLHSNREVTVRAMPEIISFLKSEGYRFVTLSQLLALQKK